MPTAISPNNSVMMSNGYATHPVPSPEIGHGKRSPAGKLASTGAQSSNLENKASVKTTLRHLYDKAKHAFLQREFRLTDQLISQAFIYLHPPTEASLDADGFDSQRRKWDILKITLYTTLYTSRDSDARLENPNIGLDLPPYQFLQRLRASSLKLFTPQVPSQLSHHERKDALDSASIGNVPDQVVFLLIVSAVKLDEIRVAKEWIEDWLIRREPATSAEDGGASEPNGSSQMTSYEKIIDVYVLHVLSRLGLWDDATEFLRYESEMGEDTKQRIMKALQNQHQAHLTGSRPRSKPPSMSSRQPSPTPSLASSTSTLPARGGNTPPRPASAASISSSASTATVRPGPRQLSRTNVTGNEDLGLTSISKLDKGKGRAEPIGNGYGDSTGVAMASGAPSDGVPNGTPSTSKANGMTIGQGIWNGSAATPLPIPPLYPNGYGAQSPVSPTMAPKFDWTARLHTRHVASVVPFVRNYLLQTYLYLAAILNTQFALRLPIDEVATHLDPRFDVKPSLWHIFIFFTTFFGLLRMLRRKRPTAASGSMAAGEAARKRLKEQAVNQSLALGPTLGLNFWKAAMRALGDAVWMAGRGIV